MEKQQVPAPQIFQHEQFGQIRGIIIDGEPWLVGIDVASALGYADPFGALKKHVDDEDKQNCQIDSFASPRGFIVINESGLFSLILRSNLPKAREFKRWVTHEVLPSLRKYGYYAMPAQNKSQHPFLTDEKIDAFSHMVKVFSKYDFLCYELQNIEKELVESRSKWLRLRKERKVLRDKLKECAAEIDSLMQKFFAMT